MPVKRPFKSALDTIRSYGLTPGELRERARLAERHGQAFLAQLYRDEAEAQEAALRLRPCPLCGGTGRIADDIFCWRCDPRLSRAWVEVRRGP